MSPLHGAGYAFWSGIGNDIPIYLLGILPLLLALYKRHKCSLCWRLSYHNVNGTHYRTCHRHLTLHDHMKLERKHRRKHPLQHELLKRQANKVS